MSRPTGPETDAAPGGGARPSSSQQPEPAKAGWDEWENLALEGDDRKRAPVFLGRDIYRRRRVMDAARLLPALGTVLLLLPMLWARSHGTAAGVVYLFVVWFGLILAAGYLSRRLSEPLRQVGRPEQGAPADGAGEPGEV
ncbi:hypothetical protein [Tropicimonas sediminicola]|uniref:Uncharacterized protein n=1 Tax=Tropicimonas sediminicola TaxID=1031541 RepID=A0A239FEY9_9RHOB|nr:hypothetical protein [Tropicimonas sediminicola]SNS54732.1 hypothetical protein SAMN05421757_102615 [Tropicimonas sediminicola]